MKSKTLAKLLGAATLVVGASSAQAVLLPIPAGTFLLSDNSAEYLINCTPGTTGCESPEPPAGTEDTTVDVGDRLHGIFLIDDISGISILAGSPYDELAGVFDVTVTAVTPGVDGFGNPQYAYQFGATPGFAAAYGLSAGAAVAWYVDPNHEFARETNSGQTTTDLENLITDGTLFWGSGISFWNALTATNDIQQIGIGAIGGGQFRMGLNLTDNFSGLTFLKVPCVNQAAGNAIVLVDQCANGNILTPATQTRFTTPYDVWDDVNFTMNRIPEPGTLALLGVGLLGIGGRMFRRRQMAA